MTTTSMTTRRGRGALFTAALTVMAACGSNTAKPDDALRNDLSLATQAQQARQQQVVSPQELGPNGQPVGQPYNQQGFVAQPTTAGVAPSAQYAPQPAPAPAVRERVVYRDRPSHSHHSSGGSYSSASSGTVREAPRPPMTRNTKRDAVIGGVAGAAIGAVTSHDKIKGGVLGGAAGAILGGVIGNNVDVKRH